MWSLVLNEGGLGPGQLMTSDLAAQLADIFQAALDANPQLAKALAKALGEITLSDSRIEEPGHTHTIGGPVPMDGSTDVGPKENKVPANG